MNLEKINLSEDAAKLILRLTVGILVLLHGVFKIMNPGGLEFVESSFGKAGLPEFLAYTVYIGEVIAPIMLIVGYKTKLASALVALTLVVAILLVHMSQILTLTKSGGWGIELQAMFLFGAIAIFGLGAGKYALDKQKENIKVI